MFNMRQYFDNCRILTFENYICCSVLLFFNCYFYSFAPLTKSCSILSTNLNFVCLTYCKFFNFSISLLSVVFFLSNFNLIWLSTFCFLPSNLNWLLSIVNSLNFLNLCRFACYYCRSCCCRSYCICITCWNLCCCCCFFCCFRSLCCLLWRNNALCILFTH